MDVFEAVDSRISCRWFLDKPVDQKIVRDLIAKAARAASGGNLQPWRVFALTGAPLAEIKRRVADAHRLVDTAADNAARAASEAASVPAARSAANRAAAATLAGNKKVVCAPMTVSVDTSDWGRVGTISVTVTCAGRFGDLSPTRVGRSATITARSKAVLDSARTVSP